MRWYASNELCRRIAMLMVLWLLNGMLTVTRFSPSQRANGLEALCMHVLSEDKRKSSFMPTLVIQSVLLFLEIY